MRVEESRDFGEKRTEEGGAEHCSLCWVCMGMAVNMTFPHGSRLNGSGSNDSPAAQ